MKQLSVLVVEKDERVRAALRKTLEARGYAVLTAASREEGYDLMDALAPDILILDDPGQARAYRLVWLDPDVPDTRVELVDLDLLAADPARLERQLEDLLDDRSVA